MTIMTNTVSFSKMHVRDYLNGIHEIRDTNASYSIDSLQTREWAHK
jgi:hypothetical protein